MTATSSISLGWAHYRLGEYDDAVRELERAVELKPADPTINDHLGDAYWRVGRELEATFQWKRALSNDPPEELKPEIERKLSEGMPASEKPVPATANGTDKDSEPTPDDGAGAGADKKTELAPAHGPRLQAWLDSGAADPENASSLPLRVDARN